MRGSSKRQQSKYKLRRYSNKSRHKLKERQPMAEESTLFKDHLNPKLVAWMSSRLHAAYPEFNTSAFESEILETLETLELKQRVTLISDKMRQHLPEAYPTALKIVLSLLKDAADTYEEGMFNEDWYIMSIGYFVEKYGLEHYDESISAMYEITKRWSAEFAIRPYLTRYEEKTLEILETWAIDENEHVRRLVSEGTRTKLPWASHLPQFIDNPQPVLRLLEMLKNDSSQYVRRSVANNLNDIAKDHPELVVETLEKWNQETTPQIEWITKHALRSLVKAGDAGALRVLGFGEPQVELQNLTITPDTIQMGDTLTISFDLKSLGESDQKLVIDYLIHFVKANGKTSPKVFKLANKGITPQEVLSIQKKHPIKPITTRKYYAGLHQVEIQVNGQIVGSAEFTLNL